MVVIKKLTVKTCGLSKYKLEEKITSEKEGFKILDVYGSITSNETKDGDLGAFVIYKGAFEAENVLTGEVYRSDTMILPDIANCLLMPIALNAKENGTVSFGISLYTEYNEISKGLHYQFTAESLIEPSGDDFLTNLRKELGVGAETQKKITKKTTKKKR